MINGISVIWKFWVTFGIKLIIISNNLFKVSVFCHRNIDNAICALNLGHFIAVTKKSFSKRLSTYLGFICCSYLPCDIDFPIY